MKALQRLRLEAKPPIPSAAALARAAGLNERVVQDVEKCSRRPSDATLIALAGALQVTPTRLAELLAADEQSEQAAA